MLATGSQGMKKGQAHKYSTVKPRLDRAPLFLWLLQNFGTSQCLYSTGGGVSYSGGGLSGRAGLGGGSNSCESLFTTNHS